MKAKVTKKEMRSRFSVIYEICDITIFQGLSPFAYSTRSEGWACDYYEVNGVCFCHGYASIGTPIPYKLVKEYSDKWYNNQMNYDRPYSRRLAVEKRLINNFVKKVVELVK